MEEPEEKEGGRERSKTGLVKGTLSKLYFV